MGVEDVNDVKVNVLSNTYSSRVIATFEEMIFRGDDLTYWFG